jgi:hypothetical protein
MGIATSPKVPILREILLQPVIEGTSGYFLEFVPKIYD